MKELEQTTKDRILFSAFVVLGIIIVAILVLEILNLNKIVLGLEVANVKIGGLTTQEAEVVLANRFDKWEEQTINLWHQGQQLTFEPREAGISLDAKATLSLAYDLGRKKNIFIGLCEQVLILFGFERGNLAPVFAIDEEAFERFIGQKFVDLEKPAENASLRYNSKTRDWEIVASEDGNIFDREQLKQDLTIRISDLDSSPINLVLIESHPEVLESETQEAKKTANRILSRAPYSFWYFDSEEKGEAAEKMWQIDRETLIDWIEFISAPEENISGQEETLNKILSASLNQDKIKDVLMTIAPNINREPINAQLVLKEGRVTAFALAREGAQLEVEETAQKTARAILEFGKSQISQEFLDKKIEIIVSKKQPQISQDNIDMLGLTSLVGAGTSNFAGSPKNRVHNIKVGAAKFNGILLKAGEEFSFNSLLGQIGPAQGYLPELVIRTNKTVPEYGGGLCQVSTTAFRAAVNSGLKITERYPHAFPVKYYNPQGFDATVYPPHPDLRFINDTSGNLLIQTEIEGTKLIFEFFGTDDGREVKIIGPTVLASYSSGAMKAVLYQEIWRDGELERKDKFYSNYKSPNLYPVIRNPLE